MMTETNHSNPDTAKGNRPPAEQWGSECLILGTEHKHRKTIASETPVVFASPLKYLKKIKAPLIIVDHPLGSVTPVGGSVLATHPDHLRQVEPERFLDVEAVYILGADETMYPNGTNWFRWPPLRECAPDPTNVFKDEPPYELGLSAWHLLALDLYNNYQVYNFLLHAAKVDRQTLHRDVWEYSGKTTLMQSRIYISGADKRNNLWLRWPKDVVNRVLSYKNPFELSVMSNTPFLEPFKSNLTKAHMSPPLAELMHLSQVFIEKLNSNTFFDL